MKLGAQLSKQLNRGFTEEDALKIELRRLVRGNKKQRRASAVHNAAVKMLKEVKRDERD